MKKFNKRFGKRALGHPARLLTDSLSFDKKVTVLSHMALQKVERDHMPVEVATSLLLEPRARLTNAMRKACLSARETHYCSTLKPKSHADHLTRRVGEAKWMQLCNWIRRVGYGLKNVEKREVKIKGMDDKAQKLRQLLMIREGLLETAQGIIQEEINKRMARTVIGNFDTL